METTDHSAGARLGRYELLERLAVGGMAEVFLAHEREGLDRRVVVKRMLPGLAEDPAFVSMFLQEARISAGINHPNVVRILELGEADGQPFIAMEYVHGVSLKDLIKALKATNGSIPVGVVVHLMVQACAGAHAAHELRTPDGAPANLVHRDLTPHNLMVDDAGRVLLLDFGIAKAAGISGDFTRTGVLRGKISYMSPEQARQEPLDRRSDVFALGVCAYELLTLERPFTGPTELQTIQRILGGRSVPLRELRPDVPLGVADVIQRAMATSLAERLPTADAFRVALRQEAQAAGVDDDPDRANRWLREAVARLLGSRRGPRSRAPDPALLVSRSGLTPASRGSGSAPGATVTRTLNASRIRTLAPVVAIGGGILAGLAFAAALVMGAVGTAVWWGAGPDGPPLEIALAPVQTRSTLVSEHEPIRRYLEARLDRPVHLTVGSSYEDTADRVVRGDVPFAMMPGSIAQATVAAHPEVRVLAVKVTDGARESQGYLVVRQDTAARSLADLAGHTICLTDPASVTGWKLPTGYAKAHGLDLQADFTVHRSRDHEQVLRDLVAGTCDVGATYSANFMTGDQRGIPVASLKILDVTGSTPNDCVLAGPAASAEEADRVARALLDLDPMRDLGVARIGASEHITGFAPPE